MAEWLGIHMMGQSNCVGNAEVNTVTDTTYTSQTSSLRRQTRYLVGITEDASSVEVALEARFSAEQAIGPVLANAGIASRIWFYRAGQSGTDLAVSWRPHVNGTLYAQAAANYWTVRDGFIGTEYGSDTVRHAALVWIQGESDTNTNAKAVAYADNLRRLVETYRNEWGPVPIFFGKLPSNWTGTGPSDPDDVNLVRAAYDTVAGEYSRVYSVDFDGVPIQSDGAHYTGDGLVGVDGIGERIAHAMLADGLGPAEVFPIDGRVWTVEADALSFATATQTEHGNRDEDPAGGGFGVRLGDGAIDPWPETPRSAIVKHPVRNEWSVLMDGVIDADTDYDRTTMRRPINTRWWRF